MHFYVVNLKWRFCNMRNEVRWVILLNRPPSENLVETNRRILVSFSNYICHSYNFVYMLFIVKIQRSFICSFLSLAMGCCSYKLFDSFTRTVSFHTVLCYFLSEFSSAIQNVYWFILSITSWLLCLLLISFAICSFPSFQR